MKPADGGGTGALTTGSNCDERQFQQVVSFSRTCFLQDEQTLYAMPSSNIGPRVASLQSVETDNSPTINSFDTRWKPAAGTVTPECHHIESSSSRTSATSQ